MLSPADESPGPAFSSTVWFSERPNFIEALREITMSDQETMRLVAEVVDKKIQRPAQGDAE
jgi:hypothetical protein